MIHQDYPRHLFALNPKNKVKRINSKEMIMIKNAIKKKIIILLILLIPTWLIGVIVFFANSDTTGNKFNKETAISLYPQAVLSVVNCEREGNKYFTLHEDPQIYISPPKNKISTTMIEFGEPVPIDSSVKIFYAKKNDNLSEENSVSRLLPKGTTEVIISIPSGIYTTLRYDIDIFGEWYEIKGIYAAEAKRDYSPLLITLIISICIFVLWVIGIRVGRINISFVKEK
jgi:hypothetical protein